MTTPTFQAPTSEGALDRIDKALNGIEDGDFQRTNVTALSGLSRKDAETLRARWPTLDEATRLKLVDALGAVAEESIDFDFNRAFRIALGDSSDHVRVRAIGYLWEDTGTDLPEIMIHLLDRDPSDDVRAAAAEALASVCDSLAAGESAHVDSDALRDQLVRIACNPAESVVVRRRALGTVAAFGSSATVTELIRSSLDDEDQAIEAGAVFAMGRTASSRWLPDVLEYMASGDAELRYEAARAAGLIGEIDAIPELAVLATDPDTEVQAAAVDALGRIGGPSSIRVLRELREREAIPDEVALNEAIDAAQMSESPLEGLS